MKRPVIWIAAFVSMLIGEVSAAYATPYDAADDIRGHLPNRTYEVYLSEGRERAVAAAAVDREFAVAMRKHHEGAVTMWQDYLADRRGTHPILRQLAEAIITNQRFEIGVLNDVLGRIDQAPRQVGLFWLRETGLMGMEHRLRFSKAPPPSGVDLSREREPLSENDVEFVKAMTRDIIIDQNYEIAFLQRLISRYPGMVHGMPGESAAMAPQSSGREAPHAGAH